MIEEVSNNIVNNTLTLTKKRFYLLFFGVSALVSIITTISSVYLTEKVSSYVVKSEFEESLLRLEKTIKSTELIQQEIKSKYTDSVEAKKILRQKYEEVYLITIEYVHDIGEMTTIALNRKYPGNADSLQKLIMLQSLYFPLLKREIKNIDDADVNYRYYLYELSKSPEERFNSSKLAPEMVENQQKVIDTMNEFREALIKKYAEDLNL